MFDLPNFVWYIVLALILTKIPVVGKYFRLFNTLVHEVGHVLVSIVSFGEVYKVKIFSDTSGSATTGSRSRISRILTSLAGYPFASGVALLLLYLVSIDKLEWVMYGIVILLVISAILWVRNLFGLAWVASFLIITLLIEGSGNVELTQSYLMIVIAVLLVESISSTVTIFWLSLKEPHNSGDAQNLARSTFIPSIVWGALFLVVSVWLGILGIQFWV